MKNDDDLLDLLAGDFYGCLYLYPGDDTGIGEGTVPWADSGLQVSVANNPCSGSLEAVITLVGPPCSSVEVSLFSTSGRLVRTLHSGTLQPGSTTLWMDAGALPTGVYHVVARSRGLQSSCSVLLLR